MVIALTFVASGCGRSDGPNASPGAAAKGGPPPAPPVSVAAALARDVRDAEELSGRLEAFETVEVRARVSGMVNAVHFQAGRDVRRGELLFTLDPRPFEVEVARAEAELNRQTTRAELARAELVRAEKLLVSKAISQQEHDERVAGNREGDAAVRAARAALEVARLNLEFTRVTAAIGGRIGRAEVTPGNWVNGGNVGATLLTTIVSLDPIYAYFEGDEQFFLKYRSLATAAKGPVAIQLGLANEEGFPHTGRLDFLDNRLDPRSGTIRARAVFDNKTRKLAPGLYARMRVEGGGTYKAVLVTDRAIGTDQDKKFVPVVGPDNMLQYRPVKLGALIEGMRVITEGLKADEVLVVNGLQRVRPGMPVTPKLVAMTADPQPPADAAAKK